MGKEAGPAGALVYLDLGAKAVTRTVIRVPLKGSPVILRGSCFRPGRSFRNCLGHLKKAWLLDERSLERYTAAVREIARGSNTPERTRLNFLILYILRISIRP